jgi:hypothetical protein
MRELGKSCLLRFQNPLAQLNPLSIQARDVVMIHQPLMDEKFDYRAVWPSIHLAKSGAKFAIVSYVTSVLQKTLPSPFFYPVWRCRVDLG